MKYLFTYYGTPITRQNFEANVPENWQSEIENGFYSYGGYRAEVIEAESE